MPTVTFTLEAEYIEVNQLLKLAGACDSGGAGKALVADGRVRVDGGIETRKTAKIRAGQTVAIDDLRIVVRAGDGA
jgi:ribosome-associated protein